MTVTNLKDALARKGGVCQICNHAHSLQQPCSREAMAHKITKLMEANSMIPGLLQHNKQATEIAEHFRGMLKRADEAHTMLMDILAGHGEIGIKIRDEYMERLNKWAEAELTSQDTSDNQLSLFSQEQSTSNGTEIKNSTRQPSGLILDPNS